MFGITKLNFFLSISCVCIFYICLNTKVGRAKNIQTFYSTDLSHLTGQTKVLVFVAAIRESIF